MISRYGEIVDVNLVRDKGTGRSRGFAFIAYEDQRSTTLAVGRFLFISLSFSKTMIVRRDQLRYCILSKRSLNFVVVVVVAVLDNLNAAQVLGRTIRVDHCSKYKKKEEEDEETERKKREERGVCRAFQRGQCTRGAGCKFSHNEQVRRILNQSHNLDFLVIWTTALDYYTFAQHLALKVFTQFYIRPTC